MPAAMPMAHVATPKEASVGMPILFLITHSTARHHRIGICLAFNFANGLTSPIYDSSLNLLEAHIGHQLAASGVLSSKRRKAGGERLGGAGLEIITVPRHGALHRIAYIGTLNSGSYLLYSGLPQDVLHPISHLLNLLATFLGLPVAATDRRHVGGRPPSRSGVGGLPPNT